MTADTNAPLLAVNGVTLQYKTPRHLVTATYRVDFSVHKGDRYVILGPSGCGKSTLLKAVGGFMKPVEGAIRIRGKDIVSPGPDRMMVFQEFEQLMPWKTVFQNVAFALEVIGRPRSQIAKVVPEVLDLVGLADKHSRLPSELSGGEQQRVAIARAFVNRPIVLLADEPTGNLDPSTSVGIMRLLDRINRTGTTVVMATHDAQIVDSMRRRVIELEGGKVVRDQSRGVYGYSS